MNLVNTKRCMDFLTDQAIQFQITGDGHGSYSIDILSKPVADVLLEELKRLDIPVQRLDRPYFYRLH